MELIVISTVFLAAAAALGLAVHALVTVIRADGYYPRRGSTSRVTTAPRSHHADLFEPGTHAA